MLCVESASVGFTIKGSSSATYNLSCSSFSWHHMLHWVYIKPMYMIPCSLSANLFSSHELLIPLLMQGPSVLTFNIGSVDSFERNLEQAQSDLDIDPANRLPVTYVAEAEWLREVLKLTPTLLILGTIIFFSRRMAGGGSGRGVGSL